MYLAAPIFPLSLRRSVIYKGRSSGSAWRRTSFSFADSRCVARGLPGAAPHLFGFPRQKRGVSLQQQDQPQQQQLSTRQQWQPGRQQQQTPCAAHSRSCSLELLQRKTHARPPTVAAAAFSTDATEKQKVEIIFVMPDGTEKPVEARIGETLLEVAHAKGVELEGACEGQCSCSTCHVILEPEVYEELPEPSEQEEDMLDMAACLTSTSRLGCQIRVTEALRGTKIRLPQLTRNFYVDGHVPSPH